MINFHNNAAALLVEAAKRSGLLREVANALHWSNSHPGCCTGGDCLACGVLEELTEEFREHCGFPGYDFFGKGFCVPEYSDKELRPYLQEPFAVAGATGVVHDSAERSTTATGPEPWPTPQDEALAYFAAELDAD